MSDSVSISWQNPTSRDWVVVGKLSSNSDYYHFHYTEGAKEDEFNGFVGMPEKHIKYSSKELFPIFKNRTLSKRRPEYPFFLQWLDLTSDATDLEVLAASGGIRQTDNIQAFKSFEIKNDDTFEYVFFLHGLSHLDESAQKYVDALKKGQKLFLGLDLQNPYDQYAVSVSQRDPSHLLGYCPRYLSLSLSLLLNDSDSKVELTVEKISDDAPKNYRLLCKVAGVASSEAKAKLEKTLEHLPYTHSKE